MPYLLSPILKRLSFICFCRIHNITTQGISNESIDRLVGYLNQHKIDNDLAMTDLNLAIKWPRFENAVVACNRGGFTDNNLHELLAVIIEMGKDKIAWSARLDMDGAGNLRVWHT